VPVAKPFIEGLLPRRHRRRADAVTTKRRLQDPSTYPGVVLFYGVVSAQTEKVIEFFLERDAAEAMIRDVREDEPMLAEDLRVEAIELG
jgi:hypothetical protein